MSYKETLDFLFASLPMYQRIGDAAIKKDLTNIRKLCILLDQPQLKFPCIHVAGTNGKGSTSHMLASVFQASGRKVGLYTSPHYVDFRERIKINGQMITEKEVIRFVDKFKDQWKVMEPSFFEITVAMAFDYFRSRKVDMAIIETGLGGRLDSTNIITPLLSVITNIGFDHMQMLGNTRKEIAYEKAGIIKDGVPVIIGEWHKETAPVFKQKAELENAPISFASKHILIKPLQTSLNKSSYQIRTKTDGWPGKITTDLIGPYQQRNIRTVLETLWCWNKYYPDQYLKNSFIKAGLKNVHTSTYMIGRWMVINKNPLIIADAAHNKDGMKTIVPALIKFPARNKHFVLGFVNDKDINSILSLFPKNGQYYWCTPGIPRGKKVEETKSIGNSHGLPGNDYSNVYSAFKAAIKIAGRKDLIFIGGSSYVVGDFLKDYKKAESESSSA
jgi:dihydrofolate synthase/folylpolyglutamate synthase